MSRYSADHARALAGPPALVEQRAAAAERAAGASRPTVEEEIWRYSRIGELDLERYEPGPSTSRPSAPSPVVVEHDADLPSIESADLFDELADAFGSATRVRVPGGAIVAEPIVIDHRLGSTSGRAVLSRLVVEVGADAEVTIVERFTSEDESDVLVVPSVQLFVGQAARVRYLAVNELGVRSWLISHQRVDVERDATALVANVALGGDYARTRTTARALGQGSTTRQIALYFADGEQMHDFRVTQEHVAPRTQADLLFKGAVNDSSRSVYTGLIKIGADAKGTAAFQTNRNLTLSDGAWAESVPNLDIETNDVKCSHASTVGPVDAEQRFYLESRGVPTDVAERLIVLGFFDEVIDQLPLDDALASELRARISAKLHAPRTDGSRIMEGATR